MMSATGSLLKFSHCRLFKRLPQRLNGRKGSGGRLPCSTASMYRSRRLCGKFRRIYRTADTGSNRACYRLCCRQRLRQKAVNYKLRDWVFSRQRYWGEPIPLVHCPKCGVVPLDEKDLPLALPETDSYTPSDTGESPLAKIPEWVNTVCPHCGAPARRETNTMPQWAGSCWYYLRYLDPHNAHRFVPRTKKRIGCLLISTSAARNMRYSISSMPAFGTRYCTI